MRCFQRNFSAFPCPLSPLQLPSPMETHVWYIVPNQFKSVSLLNQYMELLSSCEKQNVLSMRGDQLQKGALLARTLVRTTIARYQMNSHIIDPRSLKFKKNIHGKPEVDWQNDDGWCPPPLHFNISHTSSLIACGVTMKSSIGIDVEEKQRKLKNNVFAFARRYFSPPEVELLSAISDPEVQRQEFVKLWTLKVLSKDTSEYYKPSICSSGPPIDGSYLQEAYVKALGRGFSAAPFKTFTIRIKNSVKGSFGHTDDLDYGASEVVVESSDHPTSFTNNYQFGLFELISSHYLAICIEKDETSGPRMSSPMRLTVRRTIPFVEDECVSGTDAVAPIEFVGLFKQY